jgi:type III secretion system low calcium response chaperone LcrH/SycD
MSHFTSPLSPKIGLSIDNFIEVDVVEDLRGKIANLPSSTRFSEDQIEMIYGLAHSLFEQGKFENACGIFQVLLVYKPLEIRFLTAFGICCKRMARYDGAIPAFSTALIIEPGNLESGVHLAECFVALDLKEQALLVLDPLRKLAELDTRSEYILRRAEALQSLLEMAKD